MVPIDADAALGLPVDRLALHLLREIKATSEADPNWKPNRHTRLLQANQTYSHNGLSRADVTAVTRALAEAYAATPRPVVRRAWRDSQLDVHHQEG